MWLFFFFIFRNMKRFEEADESALATSHISMLDY
jgi:hypothetical protein